MARNMLAEFGLAALYIQGARAVFSLGMADRWVVQITTTDGQTRVGEADEADSITAALAYMGEQQEAALVEEAAIEVHTRNRPTAWSFGP